MTDFCTPDNKNIFEAEQPYTKQCEACSLFCKLYHYRICEKRFDWLRGQGIDPFEYVNELNRAAERQLGLKPSSPKPTNNNQPTKKPVRRGGR